MSYLKSLLSKATAEELGNLSKILGCPLTVGEVYDAIQWTASHKVSYFFSTEKSYNDLIKQAARICRVDLLGSERDWEDAIISKLFGDMWASMTHQQQREFESHIKEEYQKTGREYTFLGSASAISAFLLAKGSGFGVYLLSSIVLSNVSKALGISLGFATYIGASRAIAFFTGPAGWAITGVLTLWSLASPNKRKVLACVVQLIMLRRRIEESD